jgi:hypothetical protein
MDTPLLRINITTEKYHFTFIILAAAYFYEVLVGHKRKCQQRTFRKSLSLSSVSLVSPKTVSGYESSKRLKSWRKKRDAVFIPKYIKWTNLTKKIKKERFKERLKTG